MPAVSPSRYRVDAGWADAPHLSEAAKAELRASTLPHLRDAREFGIPSMGAGAIYPIPLSEVTVEPFNIPSSWPRAYALDVGWNNTAALWGAMDPNGGVLHVYAEHKRGQAEPSTHAAAIRIRGEWMRGAVDPAARGRGQASGEQLLHLYRALGLDLTPAVNAVDPGIESVWMALSEGRLKLFRSLGALRFEYQNYHRDENGRIVKENDHLMDCFDAETDVLTDGGWMRFAELSGVERLATVNLDTDEIEYQAPTDLIARDYVGEMVRIGGRKMDALVTPTHRMVVYPRGSDAPTIKLAKDLSVWDRIKLRGTWVGERRGPVPVKVAHGRDAEVDPIVWAELLGWYVAEGSCAQTIQMPGRGYQVVISQNVPEKVAHIRALLDQTPWNWIYSEGSGAFYTSCRWLWEQLQPLGNTYTMRAPRWVLDSEPAVIEAFLRGAVMGDGWMQNGRASYASVSRGLADDMQEAFIKTGRTASVVLGRRGSADAMVMGRPVKTSTADQWWVSEWTTPHGLLRNSRNEPNFDRVPYAGKVYCASVPNGTLIVRRNGKPMVAGNCLRYLWMTWPKVAKVEGPGRTVIRGHVGPADAIGGY